MERRKDRGGVSNTSPLTIFFRRKSIGAILNDIADVNGIFIFIKPWKYV